MIIQDPTIPCCKPLTSPIAFFPISVINVDISSEAKIGNFAHHTLAKKNVSGGQIPMNKLHAR